MMNNLEMNATNQQVEYYLIDIVNFSKKIYIRSSNYRKNGIISNTQF